MRLYDFFRLIYRNLGVLTFVPTLMAVLVFLLTINEKKTFDLVVGIFLSDVDQASAGALFVRPGSHVSERRAREGLASRRPDWPQVERRDAILDRRERVHQPVARRELLRLIAAAARAAAAVAARCAERDARLAARQQQEHLLRRAAR